jgi:hypothetical protein
MPHIVGNSEASKKACIRCSTQKRRCDRARPACGLCSRYRLAFLSEVLKLTSFARLRYSCEYPDAASPFSGPGSDNGSVQKSSLAEPVGAELGGLTLLPPLQGITTSYAAVGSWFPVVPLSELYDVAPPTWDETPIDLKILCMATNLLASRLPASTAETRKLGPLYVYLKGRIGTAEGMGAESLSFIQGRILVGLFEMAHGMLPSAYVSVGSAIRTLEALELGKKHFPSANTAGAEENSASKKHILWEGLRVLDR